MADFPAARYQLPVISAHGTDSAGMTLACFNGTAVALGGSAVWPTANLALYMPMRIVAPYLVKTLWWANGATVTGNVDCGVYTGEGTLLFNAGSTAQATINTIQKVSLGTAVLLVPGTYYLALNSSSGSATFQRTALTAQVALAAGQAQQAVGAVTLPATATFAATAQAYQPFFGIANATVI